MEGGQGRVEGGHGGHDSDDGVQLRLEGGGDQTGLETSSIGDWSIVYCEDTEDG